MPNLPPEFSVFPVFPSAPILPALPNPPVKLTFQNTITDLPAFQDQPNNGPAVPPPPHGTQPTGIYEYIPVPRQKPILPPAPYYAAFGIWAQIETQFALLNVYAE